MPGWLRLAVLLAWRQLEDDPVRDGPLACLLAEHEGTLLMPEGMMMIVENDGAKVEGDLGGGCVRLP